MIVRVRMFARARELSQADELEIELPERSTIADLRARLAEKCSALRSLLPRSALAINEEFAEDATVVPSDAEVALLPPVSGGAYHGDGGQCR